MPIRIQNKEMARIKKLQSEIYREPDANSAFGEFKDTPSYHHGQLPLFIRHHLPPGLEGKPKFRSRIPGGKDFNPGPKGSESPCKLNMLDILSLNREWVVTEHQGVMKGTMAKKFIVSAEPARLPVDTHAGGGGATHKVAQLALRDKSTFGTEVELSNLPEPVVDRCLEASHAHMPEYHFPMGTAPKARNDLMNQASCDAEVNKIFTANRRGHGDLRNESENMNATPDRLITKRSPSPAKLARSATTMSMMSSGTMMAQRRFDSPGLPEENFKATGFGTDLPGLPVITFAKRSKPPKLKPYLVRRNSVTTVKSKGWVERDVSGHHEFKPQMPHETAYHNAIHTFNEKDVTPQKPHRQNLHLEPPSPHMPKPKKGM